MYTVVSRAITKETIKRQKHPEYVQKKKPTLRIFKMKY